MEAMLPIIPYITNVGAVLTLVLLLIAFGFLIPKRFYDELKDLYDELRDTFNPMLEMVKAHSQSQTDTNTQLMELNRKIDRILVNQEASHADDAT